MSKFPRIKGLIVAPFTPMMDGGGILGGKAIMNILGIPCGECRIPLHRFTPAEYESLRHDLEAIDFFDRCKV